MEYVHLGSTGLRVSRLCIGTWMFGTDLGDGEVVDEEGAHRVLDAAREHGVTFIDTANIYGSPSGPGPGRPAAWRAALRPRTQ